MGYCDRSIIGTLGPRARNGIKRELTKKYMELGCTKENAREIAELQDGKRIKDYDGLIDVQYWVKRANETVYPLPLVSKHDRTVLFRLWAVPGPFLRIIRAHVRTYTRMSRLFPNRKRLEIPGTDWRTSRAHTRIILRAHAHAHVCVGAYTRTGGRRGTGAHHTGADTPTGGDRPSQGALGRTVGTITQTGRCGYGRSSPGEARDMRSTRVSVKKGRYRS